jgi:hypothetical protein
VFGFSCALVLCHSQRLRTDRFHPVGRDIADGNGGDNFYSDDYCLLADSGFALHRYVLTPYEGLDVHLLPHQSVYNRIHRAVRKHIECAFGALKRMFPALDPIEMFGAERRIRVVVACITLFNMIYTYVRVCHCLLVAVKLLGSPSCRTSLRLDRDIADMLATPKFSGRWDVDAFNQYSVDYPFAPDLAARAEQHREDVAVALYARLQAAEQL